MTARKIERSVLLSVLAFLIGSRKVADKSGGSDYSQSRM
jgi:hypothetical protein